jgi:hypothetical protein
MRCDFLVENSVPEGIRLLGRLVHYLFNVYNHLIASVHATYRQKYWTYSHV